MVPMVIPSLFVGIFVLLPFHKYSGNEADDDLMMENIHANEQLIVKSTTHIC